MVVQGGSPSRRGVRFIVGEGRADFVPREAAIRPGRSVRWEPEESPLTPEVNHDGNALGQASEEGRGRAGTRGDRPVVAGEQLPQRRPDLPARQPAPARAAHARPREGATRGPLGHHARPQLPVRAPQPDDPRAQPADDVHHRPRPRRPGAGRRELPRRHLHGDVPRHLQRRGRHPAPVQAVLVPRRDPVPRGARDPRLHPRGRRARLRAEPRLRGGVRQPGPAGRGGRRRRGSRDRAARHQLALQQVHQSRHGRRRAADPAPQRLQDRQPHGARPHQRRRARLAHARLRPQAARV